MKVGSEMQSSGADLYQCANSAIAVARSDADLQRIGRLRYELFIERDRKSYPEADQRNRCFIEPVDLESLNFMVMASGACIAACRVTGTDVALKDRYLSRIVENSSLKLEDLRSAVICSRFSIARTWQARRLSVALLEEGYRAIHQHDMRTILLASRRSLVSYYGKFGFREIGKSYFEEAAGELVVQHLRVHDRANLKASGSVLLKAHDQLQMTERLETIA